MSQNTESKAERFLSESEALDLIKRIARRAGELANTHGYEMDPILTGDRCSHNRAPGTKAEMAEAIILKEFAGIKPHFVRHHNRHCSLTTSQYKHLP